MSIKIDNFRCIGCSACVDACPYKAIILEDDINGFLYPYLDKGKCVECGLCEIVCPLTKKKVECDFEKKAYAFQLSEKKELENSTSGGVFTALSNIVLDSNGYIVGAVMENDFSVRHIISNSSYDRDRMRFSKYVQSNTEGVFKSVKEKLDEGNLVLFVGTPCQVSSVKAFLNVDYENLITCDFICHGVPNNKLFKEHIKWVESIYNKTAISYYFRRKTYGWNHGIDEVIFSNGDKKDSRSLQAYTILFQKNITIRESCKECEFQGEGTCADITISDFWNIDKILNIKESNGYSLAFANTVMGASYLKLITEKNCFCEVPIDKVIYRLERKKLSKSDDSFKFWSMFQQQGYEIALKQFVDLSNKKRIKHFVKKCILRIKKKLGL